MHKMATLAQLKEKFNKVQEHIVRDGVSDLVSWLETETDFFTAPASTRFHGNYEGGLVEHSLYVVEYGLHLLNYTLKYKPELEHLRESVVLTALFHDVCKVGQYSKGEKWTKINNRWASYQGWQFKDPLPIGHGEKSVYYITKFVELTDPELMAVRWHMGNSEVGTQIDGFTKYAYQEAWEHPLPRIIHAADLASTLIGDTIDLASTAT